MKNRHEAELVKPQTQHCLDGCWVLHVQRSNRRQAARASQLEQRAGPASQKVPTGGPAALLGLPGSFCIAYIGSCGTALLELISGWAVPV